MPILKLLATVLLQFRAYRQLATYMEVYEMKTTLMAGAVAAVLVTPVLAGDDMVYGRLNVPANEWKSPTAIGEILAGQGYKVHKIESDDGAYEVDMTDKNGVLVEVHVHPSTGDILAGYDD